MTTTDKDKIRAAAQKFLQKGQLDRAIKELERLVVEDPNDVRVRLKIGDLHSRRGDLAAASTTYLAVAKFYSEQGFFLKAVAVYKQLLKLNPTQVDLNLRLAELYHQLNLVSDALAQYRTIYALYERDNRTLDCLAILRKMVELDANNVAVRVHLAEAHAKGDRPAEAVAEFKFAAQQLGLQKATDEQQRVLERLLQIDATDVSTSLELGIIYLEKKDPKRALSRLQTCFRANPRDVDTLDLLARAFADTGQIHKAAAVLRELGHVHAGAGDTARHDAVQLRLLSLLDGSHAQTDQQAPAGGLSQASAMPNLSESSAHSRSIKDTIFAKTFGPGTATVLPGSNVGLSPTDTEAETPMGIGELQRLLAEAESFARYGLRNKAIETLGRVLTANPGHRESQLLLVDLHIAGRNLQAATDLLWDMAQAARRTGQGPVAFKDLQRLLKLDPQHAAAAAAAMPHTTAAQSSSAAEPQSELPFAEPELLFEIDAGVEVAPGAAYGLGATVVQTDTGLSMQLQGQSPGPGQSLLAQGEHPDAALDLSAELDEVQFFASQGLYDEAQAALRGLEKFYPDHPGVQAARATLRAPANETAAAADPIAAVRGQSLEVDDHDIEVPFDDTFDLFKVGVAKQVDNEDFETHYNLGIAYKEMGLLDDAEREFTIAQATPRLQITSFMMVGLCQLQRGNTHGAINQFMKGLAAPQISSQEQVALRYEVAAAYEQMGRLADALKFYEHAFTMDREFRDVAQKLAELTTQTKSSEEVASAELDILLSAALPHAVQVKPGR